MMAVYSHPETWTRHGSPHVNAVKSYTFTTSALVRQKLFPSAEMCISCLTNRAKTTSSESSNFDANQITAVSINFPQRKENRPNVKQSNGWNAKSTSISVVTIWLEFASTSMKRVKRQRKRQWGLGLESNPDREGSGQEHGDIGPPGEHLRRYIVVLEAREKHLHLKQSGYIIVNSTKVDTVTSDIWDQNRRGKKKTWWKLAGLCFCDTNFGGKNPVLRHFPSVGTLPLTQGPRCFSTIGTRV